MILNKAEQRAKIYKLLSDCYQSPNEDFCDLIQELHKAVSQIYPDLVSMAPASPSLSQPAESIEELKVEHARLFLGPFKLLAPPYGSVYLDHNEHLMTDSSRDVQSRYEEEGMTVAIQEVPDHICIELEFLYLLTYKEMKLIELANSADNKNGVLNSHKSDTLNPHSLEPSVHEMINAFRIKQLDFLKTHLARWFPQFEKKIRKHAALKVYRDLATLTRNFLAADLNAIMKDHSI